MSDATLRCLAVLLALMAAILAAAGARAQTAVPSQQTLTATLTITIQAPLGGAFSPSSPTIACGSAAGTVVATFVPTGGDGNPVTLALTGGDVADFAASGLAVVVGPHGIAPASCGTTVSVQYAATQP